jgi:RNA polymerase sigma-70 factor (ECF subfamily)
MVYNLALKLVADAEMAECVLQETFLKVFEKLTSFRGEASLRTWIYRIAANAALMMLRQRKGELISVDQDEASEASSKYARMLRSLDRDPLEMLLDVEFKSALEKAMAELPDSWRVAFVLKDVEGMSLQEIAAELNTTVPAVKALLHRGRMALRDKLAEFIEKQKVEKPTEKARQKKVKKI